MPKTHPKTAQKYHSLFIEDLKVMAHVGCDPSERNRLQDIRVDLEFRFKKPKAHLTDNLNDTVCYSDVCDAVKNVCEAKEFRLIEALAYELSLAVKKITKVPFSIKVRKLAPPVEDLYGGSHYRISDFP